MSAVQSLGKYEIRRQLGRGAMGVVYEGFDPVIERIVAIKTVRLPDAGDDETAEEIARFRREAQAAGRLIHPNIVGVFDYGETTELAYIVMEYVDGPPLKALLDKNERFPLPTVVRIMEDLLNGLQFSHERGVVHRDIKPANLMLTKAGQAKIADFGIARIESSSMTQAGTVLGTPAYMSPEQFMGQVVDARSDIYSSGVLLYQLLTGERPFEGSMSAIMHKALNTEAPSPSQISVTAPRPFDAVVRRAMAKRPDDRYTSAAEFLAAIRAAVAAPSAADEHEDSGDATMVATPRAAAPGAAPRVGGSPDGGDMPSAVTRTASGMATAGAGGSRAVAGGAGLDRSAAGQPVRGEAAAGARKSSALPIIAGSVVAGLAVLGGVGYFLLAGNLETHPASTEPARPALTPPAAVSAPPDVTPATPPPASVSPPAVAPVSPPVPTPVSPPVVAPVSPLVPTPVSPPVAAPASPPVAVPAPVSPPAAVLPPAVPVSPPVSLPTTVTPPPIVPPPDPADGIRAEVAAFVSRLPCSLLDGDVRDGAIQVTGIGGRAAIDSLRQKLASMAIGKPVPSLRVTQMDQVFCTWEDFLRPLAKTFGEGGERLSLRLAGDPSWLVKDDYIRPRLAMAGFRGELHVDYLDRQGNVLHLYPQVAEAAQQLSADPPRMFDPGEPLSLGEPGPSNRGWQVDEPFGTDMIIAIATEDALFDHPRPTNVEKTTIYLRDLRRAVELARSRGGRVTATALPVETRRK